MISYDSVRGGVSVITEKGDTTTSYLLIQNADLADSGKYSCSPSNADVAFVRVHVLNGKCYFHFYIYKNPYMRKKCWSSFLSWCSFLLYWFVFVQVGENMDMNVSHIIQSYKLYTHLHIFYRGTEIDTLHMRQIAHHMSIRVYR